MALSAPQPSAPDPRDAFLDQAAHQLRSPLTPLLMLAHLIGEDAALPTSLRPRVALLRENVERSARLVDDLADFCRLRSGRLQVEADDLDFAALVAEAVAAHAQQAAERHLRIEPEYAATVPRLRGDGARLRRALDTMLGNALKHADPGSAISVRTRRIGDTVALTVTDQGRGIAPAVLATLFAQEWPTGHARTATHLGVGLVLAHAVAELHHGSLVAHSDGPGRGATFTLRLPTN